MGPMTHWTEDVFVDRPEVFRGELEARVEEGSEEAAALLELLADEHDLAPASALDVACGIGRHAVALADRGLAVTGLDISPDYLERARERAGATGVEESTTFVQCDMRELDAVDGHFDLVVNLWTSFGYFDEETNRAVLAGMRERVADGGALVVEMSNKEGVLADFDGDGVHVQGDAMTVETREYEPATSRMSTEREVFEATGDDYEHVGTMTFELRTYAPVELSERLLDAGFESVTLYGGVDGRELTRESTRLLAVARP